MKRVDLVFRQAGERTAEAALSLAERHIRPERVHVIAGVRPFAAVVERMLEIDHDCDVVVYVDADCLLFEELREFIEFSSAPFVDARVKDRLRGRARCGLHIVRRDVVRAMAYVQRSTDTPPPRDDLAAVLRPESALRHRALRHLRLGESAKYLHALHDHLQQPEHLFAKAALRELRSRAPTERDALRAAMARWDDQNDFRAAAAGVAHAARSVPDGADAESVHAYLEVLPEVAVAEMRGMAISPLPTVEEAEVQAAEREHRDGFDAARPKVFGIGLGRTGTHTLTRALEHLEYEAVHYPVDAITLRQLGRSWRGLSILDHYHGITDITAAAIYPVLDKTYLGARFILTVREKRSWLKSMRQHWHGKLQRPLPDTSDGRVHAEMRRHLRLRVYGTEQYDEAALGRAYDRHLRDVRRYFRGRPDDLLVLDVVGGEGWEKLAPFLDSPEPDVPFPHEARGDRPRPKATWQRRQRLAAGLRRIARGITRRVARLRGRLTNR